MLDFIVTVFLTFLVVFDPVAVLPVFIALTQHQSPEYRRKTAIRSITVAAVTLIVLAFLGNALLQYLGIGIPAFRIAGGLLLFLLSIDMVFARQSGLRSTTPAENKEASDNDDIAVFPLAIPLIAGPGAMTSLILLMGRADSDPATNAIVLAIMLAVLAICLGVMLLANPIVEKLGVTGINVIGRVFGVMLAALAAQYMIDGVSAVAAGLRLSQ